ncbi:MAG: M43 family zinc metalloprotease [Bacteroidota bacterium]
MIAREEKINRILYQLLDRQKKTGRSAQSANDETYVIPVVVHVVHNGGSENISDAQVFAGVQHMNDVFANVGVYDPSTGVSIGIQFCLAKQDTNGIFNTGITRTSSPLTEMTMETQDIALKNLVRWNPRKYMNIWLVREVNSTSSGPGVVGYAYFPSSHGAPEDGIVGEARWFGSSTDNSKIFAHEAGHYLGLYHTFEGGCINNDCLADGDRICDTPPDGTTAPVLCGTPFNSCTTDVDDRSLNNPFRPVADGGLGDQGDLYIDYMDYGRPECYTVFTQGQKDRMRAVLTEIRKSLLESKGCLSPCTSPVIASFTTSSVLVIAGTTVMFTNTSTGASLYEWRVDGAVITTNANASYTFNTQGHYTVALKALNGDPACADIDSITIEVTCPVRASFSADRQTALSGQTVTFTNTATGATTYEWLLDGVLIGTSQDLQHIFGTDGGYQVILIASNGICRDTSLAMLIRVGGCSPPKEWNIWYFGNGAGIDFNSGTPTGITDGVLFSREGVASICDRDGNLLCYSDGLDLPR